MVREYEIKIGTKIFNTPKKGRFLFQRYLMLLNNISFYLLNNRWSFNNAYHSSVPNVCVCLFVCEFLYVCVWRGLTDRPSMDRPNNKKQKWRFWSKEVSEILYFPKWSRLIFFAWLLLLFFFRVYGNSVKTHINVTLYCA